MLPETGRPGPKEGEDGEMAVIRLIVAVLLTASACGGSGGTISSAGSASKVPVVGGEGVQVTSIITNPNTDPHDYDPTPNDARLIAQARFVIVNGAGYDAWASRLLDSNPAPGRKVLNVGHLLGTKDGDNPHMWYSPPYVTRVTDEIAADLKTIDPGAASVFDSGRDRYENVGLTAYHDVIATIRQKYSGTPVGASESIFAYMAPALGLNLITPYGYMKAI